MRQVMMAWFMLGALTGADAAKGQSAPEVRRASVERRIGGPGQSSADLSFGDIRGLWLDARGRVFVADATTNSVRLFAPDGRLEATLGRDGAGPGEFSQPCCAGVGPDGMLWVKDFGNRRYNAFTIAGSAPAYTTTVRGGSNPVGFFDRISWSSDGRIIDVQSVAQAGGAAPRFVRTLIARDGAATILDTVQGIDPKELKEFVLRREGGTSTFAQPFGPRSLVAFGPDGLAAVANSANYTVRLLARGGRLIRVLEREVGAGPELSERERANAGRTIETVVSRNGIRRSDLRFDVPTRKPLISSLGFDQDGRLWIRRSTADGAEGVADLYGADGALIAEVRWPANVRLHLHAATGWNAVGIETQSDETIIPVVLRLQRVAR